jgi:hypothetical protein
MDISRNQIDLMFLSNRLKMVKVNHIKENRTILKKEKDKYKKKILQLVNSFMDDNCTYDNAIKNELKMIFDDFLLKTISYYKFQNKERKVQSQYGKEKEKKFKKCNKLDLNEIDITIMKKPKKSKNKNLDTFIKKKKNKNKKKKTIMPKKIDYES